MNLNKLRHMEVKRGDHSAAIDQTTTHPLATQHGDGYVLDVHPTSELAPETSLLMDDATGRVDRVALPLSIVRPRFARRPDGHLGAVELT